MKKSHGEHDDISDGFSLRFLSASFLGCCGPGEVDDRDDEEADTKKNFVSVLFSDWTLSR